MVKTKFARSGSKFIKGQPKFSIFYLYLSFGKAVFREVTHGLFTFNAAPFNFMYFLSLLTVYELHVRRYRAQPFSDVTMLCPYRIEQTLLYNNLGSKYLNDNRFWHNRSNLINRLIRILCSLEKFLNKIALIVFKKV